MSLWGCLFSNVTKKSWLLMMAWQPCQIHCLEIGATSWWWDGLLMWLATSWPLVTLEALHILRGQRFECFIHTHLIQWGQQKSCVSLINFPGDLVPNCPTSWHCFQFEFSNIHVLPTCGLTGLWLTEFCPAGIWNECFISCSCLMKQAFFFNISTQFWSELQCETSSEAAYFSTGTVLWSMLFPI